MSIFLRCCDTNLLWGMSESYLYLALRWRALNRQFITLSHFRLCFLADKWHLLPKLSGWASLPAATDLLGWAPNIFHNSSCLSMFECDVGVNYRWASSSAAPVPQLVMERVCGRWSSAEQHPPVHSCNAATQQLCQTECKRGLAVNR